jgi:uncharacterized membrane protein YdjX (TVP38/TMEM64 family)
VTATPRLIILVLAVAAMATIAFLLPLRTMPASVHQLGVLAPVAGVVVGAALLMALVPRTPISLACGLLFGAGLGMVCAIVLTVIAASITFVLGRTLGRDFAVRRAGRRWQRLERWVAREGVLAVAAVRSLPLAPYGLVGYAYGASGVRFRDYGLGTLLAGTPSAVTYALLGAAMSGAATASPLTMVPLACGLVLAAVVAIRTRRHARARMGGLDGLRVASAAGDTVSVRV